MKEQFEKQALEYHRLPRPGKIEIAPTKPLANQRDLALAYSPGVAIPCEKIAADPGCAADYTSRGNLVAVISNGTAVLGLGNIGPLAAKPVMEGKGVLFKKFAGIDVFDIEINELDPDKLVDIIASLEPTFGGINLEDIKAPECFYVERKLSERMKIPVFHDDQHGTAIISAAALINALKLVEKDIGEIRVVCSGAGAAATACLNLFITLGLNPQNIIVLDRQGVLHSGRNLAGDPFKAQFVRDTPHRTLADAMHGADVFLGLSVAGTLTGDMVKTMADKPIILALANPVPEIMPDEARAARPDAIIATGRSDYPNQVNNVLCFPYMFRGALDVGATSITEEMKIACVQAIAELTMQEASDTVMAAYAGEELRFGPDYLIPKPFDPRLILSVAPAVARAAMESGVATRPLANLDTYRDELSRFVFQSVLAMRPMFTRAKNKEKRLVYADGEEPQILRAVQAVIDEGLARPILIGRPAVIKRRVNHLGLRIRQDEHYEVVNPERDPRYRRYWEAYHQLMKRKGITMDEAKMRLRTNNTVIAAMLVRLGDADAMLCGLSGLFQSHLKHVEQILGTRDDVRSLSALSVLIMRKGTFFISDTYVNPEPGPTEIAESTLLAVEQMRRFGITPRVALLSHSDFGEGNTASAAKMREALAILQRTAPDLEVDGEMQANTALSDAIRLRAMPDSKLTGPANLLVMPDLDSANIAMNLLAVLGEGATIGPVLLGARYPAHILTPNSTVRRITNMSAIAVVDALGMEERLQAGGD
ncbi:MAG: NADP-dependent malic enzyme [Gammaproteobacteria bacterium]|nr:NADP-dependent malic enzyme [Gammaproteobacteria bacterium]